MIYLDNAATSYPKPPAVNREIALAAKRYFSNPGRGGYASAIAGAQMIFSARKKLAAFFGTDIQNVAFTYNCTTAVNIALKGILKENDHILISDLEHNAVRRPVHKLVRENKITYDIFETDLYSVQNTLDAIESKLKKETKLIVCTHASNVLGCILPIKQIGELCRKKGICFVVDAAQSAGIIPIDMRKMNIRLRESRAS